LFLSISQQNTPKQAKAPANQNTTLQQKNDFHLTHFHSHHIKQSNHQDSLFWDCSSSQSQHHTMGKGSQHCHSNNLPWGHWRTMGKHEPPWTTNNHHPSIHPPTPPSDQKTKETTPNTHQKHLLFLHLPTWWTTCWTGGIISGLLHGQTQCRTSTSTTSSQEKTKETTEDSMVVELSHCQKVSHKQIAITQTQRKTSLRKQLMIQKLRKQFKKNSIIQEGFSKERKEGTLKTQANKAAFWKMEGSTRTNNKGSFLVSLEMLWVFEVSPLLSKLFLSKASLSVFFTSCTSKKKKLAVVLLPYLAFFLFLEPVVCRREGEEGVLGQQLEGSTYILLFSHMWFRQQETLSSLRPRQPP